MPSHHWYSLSLHLHGPKIESTFITYAHTVLSPRTLQQLARLDNLRDDCYDVRNQVAPLLGLKPEPRLFVKPADWRALSDAQLGQLDSHAPPLNRWSVYGVYRSVVWAPLGRRLLGRFILTMLFPSCLHVGLHVILFMCTCRSFLLFVCGASNFHGTCLGMHLMLLCFYPFVQYSLYL